MVTGVQTCALPIRSEEHTSELHHHGISYAVFCLKIEQSPRTTFVRRQATTLGRKLGSSRGVGPRHERCIRHDFPEEDQQRKGDRSWNDSKHRWPSFCLVFLPCLPPRHSLNPPPPRPPSRLPNLPGNRINTESCRETTAFFML